MEQRLIPIEDYVTIVEITVKIKKGKAETLQMRQNFLKNKTMKGIIASGSAETKREIVKAGTHIATCYSMIHIGTVEWEYQGEKKWSNKVKLTFELPNEMRDFGGEQKPMVISKEYTISLHEKSNLRLSIIHKTSKGGNEFAQIGNVSAPMNGMEIPEQINETFIFNYEDNFNQEWLDKQPSWIKDQIIASTEYKKMVETANDMPF